MRARLLALLLLIPAAVRAQESADPFAGRLEPATAQAVRQIIDSAAAVGLPSPPLVNKALEGASKGAAGERIVIAVRSLATDLSTSRRALGRSASEAELMAGVGALRAGASPELLRRLKAARGSESALVALTTLADLVAQGLPVDRAAQRVLAAAERRADRSAQTTAPPPRANPASPPAKGRSNRRP